MDRMGALRRKMPITHWTMLIGALAIAGIPPLAGFFSKDEILGEAFKLGFQWVWLIGVVVGAHDRVLHVPADGQDVLRREPRGPGGGAARSTSRRRTHDRAAHPAGHPVRRRGHRASGLPLGDSTINHWLEPVFQPARGDAGRRTPEPSQLFGIDGALILVSVAVATIGMVAALAPVRLLPRAAHA